MKVLITPRSYAKHSTEPLSLLSGKGVETVRNETGSIMPPDEFRRALAGCDGVIIGVEPLTAEVLEEVPTLRAVAKYGVGTDNIDLAYCEEHGIKVSITAGANSDAVADYALALMLALARKVNVIDARCRRGDWKKLTTSDVARRKLGLLGLGAIGRGVARRARGFSMDVLAYDVYWDEAWAAAEGVARAADPDEICRTCDFISLHLPLTDETAGIIGADRIALMKPDAFLINTARGGLIDDAALLAALRSGSIGGAGLDVFAVEPPEDPAWYGLDNVVMGSHCAASTVGAINAMGMAATENIIRDLGLQDL
jgi:D-3-phosphoglycerate dehydrogenase